MAEKCAAIASSIHTYFDLRDPQAILNYPFPNKWKSAFRLAVTVKTVQCWQSNPMFWWVLILKLKYLTLSH